LHQAVVASLQDADVRAKLAETGLRIVGNSPAEFAAFLAQEIEKFSSVVKAANIKAE
jgi:tripartite-type tricarboxylate transporter receptor subunit TctC